ncbi:MAG: sulfurtransferase [Flammeovirgaceae bacterium]
MNTPLVSPQWLHDHLTDPDLIILDASQKQNKAGLTSDYDGQFIQGARLFDIKNAFSDPDVSLPNTLPSPPYFEQACQKLGINRHSKLVVYDKLGIFSSPRVWWMFSIMGHQQIAVLDGGLPAWIESGYETTDSPVQPTTSGDFKANFSPSFVKSIEAIDENIQKQHHLIVDARSSGRFNGTSPEPRAGLPSGHIPHSVNLPFQEVLVGGKFKSPEQLKAIFNQLNPANKALTFSCGSGITACILSLASELGTGNKHTVFDGSWTQWATERLLPTQFGGDAEKA